MIPAQTCAMAERPILFSAPMVRALLAGTKTQTRRIVKPQPDSVKRLGPFGAPVPYRLAPPPTDMPTATLEKPIRCPYGVPGDVLWVRENVAADRINGGGVCLYYPADKASVRTVETNLWERLHHYDEKRRRLGSEVPSIHMPRWASRITLRITDVRVERLNDISADDADAECFGGDFPENVLPELFPKREGGWGHLSLPECYARLWEHINGPGSWGENPWIWALTFERVA
jgi:hypothetical protein